MLHDHDLHCTSAHATELNACAAQHVGMPARSGVRMTAQCIGGSLLQDVVDVHDVHEEISTHLSMASQPSGARSQRLRDSMLPHSTSAADAAAAAAVKAEADANVCTEETAAAADTDSDSSDAPHGAVLAAPDRACKQRLAAQASNVRFAAITEASDEGASSAGSRSSTAAGGRRDLAGAKGMLSFASLRTPDQQTCEQFMAATPGLDSGDGVPAGEIAVEKLEDVSSGDWGLEMLVKVGEAWAPALLSMTECATVSLQADSAFGILATAWGH